MNKTRTLGNLGVIVVLILLSFIPTWSGVSIGAGFPKLPLSFIGTGLRNLSLSGTVGNIVAIVLYILICLLPLLCLLKGKRHIEDLLLPATSAAMLFGFYYIINPSLRAPVLMGEVGNMVLECVVYSIFFTWCILRLVRYCCGADRVGLYRVLWLLCMVFAALCIFMGFGGGWETCCRAIEAVKAGNTAEGVRLAPTYAFLYLRFAADAAEYCLTAWVFLLAGELVMDVRHDPYSDATLRTSLCMAKWCRISLTVTMLMMVLLNVGQLLLAKGLHHLSAEVHIPLLGITVTLVMMAIGGLLAKGVKLKRENDSFV